MSTVQLSSSNQRPFFGLTFRRVQYLIIVAWCLVASVALGLDRSDTDRPGRGDAFSTATSSNAPQLGAPVEPIARQIVGDEFDFTVADGDSFVTIGSRFGENPRRLARDNGKEVSDRLHAGREYPCKQPSYRAHRGIGFDRG